MQCREGLGMATLAGHLSVEALRERYISSLNVREARHFQTIWLVAKGHSIGEVAEITSFGERWIEELLARYNAQGPAALGDLRRHNGAQPSLLTPEVLEKLRVRLSTPPDGGGLWTSAKAAAFIACELGLERVAVQRGWEALKACGMSIQTPRPKNPKSATPEEAADFKKNSKTLLPKRPLNIPAGRLKSSPATNTGSV
jgi:transposase